MCDICQTVIIAAIQISAIRVVDSRLAPRLREVPTAARRVSPDDDGAARPLF